MAGYRRRRSFHIGSCFAGGAVTALLLIALGFDRRLPARMLAAEERAEKALGLHLHNPMAMRDRSGDSEQRQGGAGDQTPSGETSQQAAAATAGSAVQPVDLQTQSSEQLADLMMWWRHSKPVKSALEASPRPFLARHDANRCAGRSTHWREPSQPCAPCRRQDPPARRCTRRRTRPAT